MSSSGSIRMVGVMLAAAWLYCGPAPEAIAQDQWWQRGQDTWYYKDDWKGVFLSGPRKYNKSIDLPEAPKAAYIYVWSTNQTLRVNGRDVGSDGDDGTIEDYDLTSLLKAGKNTIEVDCGGEFICEGAAIMPDGKQINFATDASWGEGNVKTSKVRTGGPRAYSGDTHMARMMAVTDEQKAKAVVNRLNSIRRRILDRDRYTFWKSRDPREVLTLGAQTPEREQWRLIETLLDASKPAIAQATQLVLDGRFAEVDKAAAPAIEKTRQAETVLTELLAKLQAGAQARGSVLEGETPAKSGEYRSYNNSAYNRLGWVASCEPLDNDPTYWEFDVAPAGAASIGLAGRWQFALDSDDKGVSSGLANADFDDTAWKSIFAPSKWGWERWGYTQANRSVRTFNKPYSGLAWYRKSLAIPAEWQGNDLVLTLGPRWNNKDWLAVNGQWINEPPRGGSGADAITIPAKLIKFGQKNTLALRVLNDDNIGGIINPGLRLSVAAKVPQDRRNIVGPGSAREVVYQTPDGPVTQIAYSSALSPGVMVASTGKVIRIGGWTARGYQQPGKIGYITAQGPRGADFTSEGVVDSAAQMSENWLLLATVGAAAADTPRPLQIVFEKRPAKLAVVDDGFGGKALELTFAEAGARIVLLRPYAQPSDPTEGAALIERSRLWSHAMLRYPVGYHEQLAFTGSTCRVTMSYDYLELADDWKTQPLEVAPLPMLFSYAIESKWPGAMPEADVTDLGCKADSGFYPGSDSGTYRVRTGQHQIAYSFDRMEPKVHYKGAGTLNEERSLGEPMYAAMQRWGFSGYRAQTDIPSVAAYGRAGEIKWFDTMLDLSRKHELVCFINWFTSQQVPENRRQDFIARWVALANHCKDLPAGSVVYDFINEPAGIQWTTYNKLMKDATAAVREVDKVHTLSVEFGGGWAQPEDADMTEPTGDANTIYQFHFYGPHTGDPHRQDLWYPRYQTDEERFVSYEGWEERMLSPIRFMIRTHQEVMHGEFGISFLGPDEATRGWLEDVLAIHEKYRMHWNWWNYSGNDINRTGLVARGRINPLVETLSKYAKMKPPGEAAKAE